MTDTTLAWVPEWLSHPRWETYLLIAKHDQSLALALYEWNIAIAQSFMHDAAHIEIALRNRYNTVLSQELDASDHWLFVEDSPVNAPLSRTRKGERIDVNAPNRRSIAEAIRRCPQPKPSSSQVIAELSFGFWRHMTDAAHEKTLWIPYLHKAYPARTDRRHIDRIIGQLNDVRNRASHHEPFITPNRLSEVGEAGKQIVDLAKMILPSLAEHIQDTSTLGSILTRRPTN